MIVAQRRRKYCISAAAVMILSLMWLSPRPAHADLTDEQWAARQERLDYWSTQLVGDLDSNEVATLPWYVDIVYDVPNNAMSVYTKGPAKVLGLINPSVIPGAAAEGITVTEISKPKSLQDMLTEQEQLYSQVEADGVIQAPFAIDVNSSASTQSLEVTAEDGDFAAPAGRSSGGAAVEAYASSLSEIVGIPVQVTLSASGGPETTTRQNDSSPWYGGLGLIPPTNTYCSGAFGARKTVSGVTSYYMLTAYHCKAGTYKDRASETVGSTGSLSSSASAKDVAAIKISNGTSGNKVFDGAWNNSSSYAKYVGSVGSARKGKQFCTSGANSGVHCYMKVNKVNTTVKYANGQKVTGLVRAQQVNSGIGVAQGDSGGPVFGPHAGSWTKVQAIGVISGGHQGATCPSLAYTNGSRCFYDVLFQPIKSALSLYGLQLNLG